MRQSLGRAKRGAKLAPHVKDKARDQPERHTGKGRTTLAKAEVIIAASEVEPDNPKIKRLVETMDKSGRANGPYRRLTIMRQADAICAEPPPLPGNGPYRVGAPDPPWPYEIDDDDPAERAVRPYPTMTINAICAMDVSSIMREDTILWLWTTSFHMRHAFTVLDVWGFEPKTILTWVKNRVGMARGCAKRPSTALWQRAASCLSN